MLLVLETTTMVSRPPTDRQTIDLENAGSCTAWNVSFMAKFCTDRKTEKFNSGYTIVYLQVTNLFLSMCGQDAFLKLRSLMSPKKLVDTPFKEIIAQKSCRTSTGTKIETSSSH